MIKKLELTLQSAGIKHKNNACDLCDLSNNYKCLHRDICLKDDLKVWKLVSIKENKCKCKG
jgi:hypothetical protein